MSGPRKYGTFSEVPTRPEAERFRCLPAVPAQRDARRGFGNRVSTLATVRPWSFFPMGDGRWAMFPEVGVRSVRGSGRSPCRRRVDDAASAPHSMPDGADFRALSRL